MSEKPTQFEQENDLGRGGGEVDDDMMKAAEREAVRRRSTANIDDEEAPRRSQAEIDESERDERSEGFGPPHES